MPKMETAVRTDVEDRLTRYLAKRQGYHSPIYIADGGSAALFKVMSPNGLRAIKVYDPRFLTGDGAAAERRRLDLQRTLIGHGCPSLVQYHRVDEAEATAFVEMDFIDAPPLKQVLPAVPDEAIGALMDQLVSAVEYLETAGVVHRDIKPENIHVTEDFATLTLIDLGVARELDRPDEEGPDSTDHGKKRPFISTAQYSSPEYLFRLTEPTPDLWRALSIYQVGAVLHDLINKRPLFQSEVESGNKWLVARAVLMTAPVFEDASPHRLFSEKALAARCLAKSIDTRLATVRWSDFRTEMVSDPLAALAAKLETVGVKMPGGQALDAMSARYDFERSEYLDRIAGGIRRDLTPVCATRLSFVLVPLPAEHRIRVTFELPGATVTMTVLLEWRAQVSDRLTQVSLTAGLDGTQPASLKAQLLCQGSLDSGIEQVVATIVSHAAKCLTAALDIVSVQREQDVAGSIDLIALCHEKDECR